jgi:hypothetical protein
MLCSFIPDTMQFLRLYLRSSAAVAAENLLLCTQLALYQERHVKPKCATNATQFSLVWLSQWFDWRPALAVVQPAPFQRWRRQRFRLFRCWTAQPRRPPIPYAQASWSRSRPSRAGAALVYIPAQSRAGPHCQRRFRGFHPWRAGCVCTDHRTPLALATPIRRQRIAADYAACRRCYVPAEQDRAGPTVWSLDAGDVLNIDDRSLSDIGPLGNSDFYLTARTTPVDRCALYPAVAALCGWIIAGPHSLGSQPLCKGGIRAVP